MSRPFGLSRAGIAGIFLLVPIALAAFWPELFFPDNPATLNPVARLRPPSADHWMGTDMLGRDLYSRIVYGARTSLMIGFSVAATAVVLGSLIGLVSGFSRTLDPIIMRLMDGLMAIPGILLAIATVAISGASVGTVIVAIALPDIPHVVRLTRGDVLAVREELYVDAAIAAGTRVPAILWRHVLPNVFAPVIILGTYIASSAILTEAALSFLGTGLPPEVPSWGNIIAEGRAFFRNRPELVFIPGFLLAVTVLSANLFGDSLRDALDPRRRNRR